MNPLWDNHMHSSFSGDCNTPIEEMIAAAKHKHLAGITITDHLDLDYLEEPGLFDLDLPTYIATLDELSALHNTSSFSILHGIELGLQPHLADKYHAILSAYDFDYVIGSTHVIHGEDPYYPKYFSTRDKHTAFGEYYEAILENIQCFSDMDALGHLDYGFRYGPYVGELNDTYTPYREIVDKILSFIIKKDIALEVNTGAYRCGLSEPNPCTSIIKRYHAMGGKRITIGADAHKTEHVGLRFSELPALLRSCGFSQYYIYKKRKPIAVSLENN